MQQASLSIKAEPVDNELENLHSILIQNVNHELRTPLAIILGYVDLLREGEFGILAPEQEQAFYMISNRAQELNTLIERISTLLTIKARHNYLHPLSFLEIMTDVVKKQRVKAQEKDIIFEFYQPATLPHTKGNAHYLKQAVDCLIENALKFTPAGGRVEVQLNADEGWITLTVNDTGIGISEEKLTDIFNPFYQIDGSATRTYGGVGLGLTIVKAVVDTHAGQIEVTSRPGQGSQFTIRLPILPATTTDQEFSPSNTETQHILIVDDEKNVVLLLQEALTHLPNCEIMTAASGKQALELCAKKSFNLLITDYNMTDVDGLTLATQLRELSPQTSIIMLTGYANDLLRQQASNISIKHVLDKPVKMKEIRHIATEVLAAK